MKHPVERKDPDQVSAAFPLTGLLEDWYFRVREVSAGQFAAEGTDLWGRKVSHQGGEPQAALNQCVGSAKGVARQAGLAGAA
jgi:hypothetical protein